MPHVAVLINIRASEVARKVVFCNRHELAQEILTTTINTDIPTSIGPLFVGQKMFGTLILLKYLKL